MAAELKSEKQGKGVITNVTINLDHNNEQRAKDWGRGMMYDFNIEFNNGDKGVVSGKTPMEYTYPIGTEVTYTVKEYVNGFAKIGGVKKVQAAYGGSNASGGGTAFKSSYNDPTIVSKMAMSVSMRLAISLAIALNANLDSYDIYIKYVNFIYNWVIKKGLERDTCSNRWYSLEQAIELVQFGWPITSEENKTQQVIELAEKVYNHVDSVSVPPTN